MSADTSIDGSSGFREEKDTMGIMQVPDAALWGAQTQRSLENFRISSEKMPIAQVHALAMVKKACASVNAELGQLPADKAKAIIAAADEVLAGRHDREFPLAVWQTGSGTQSNMNVNEVLANRATATITSVDTTKTQLRFLGNALESVYACYIALTNSTTVTATRFATASAPTVSWELTEFH